MGRLSFGLVAFLFFLAINSYYIVDEAQQAIIVQFGKPMGDAKRDAGLYFKTPFIQDVLKFDKRLLEWDGDPNEIPTKDNKYIIIDAFARWEISDPLEFYKSARTEQVAQSRLDDILNGAIRDEIANRVMDEIIRSTNREMAIYDSETSDETINLDEKKVSPYKGARLEIVKAILDEVTSKLVDLNMGIRVVDVQIKRVNYNREVQEKLFNRMISDQNRIAEKYRAQGVGKKQEILGQQIQRKKEIMSEAYLESQRIRGDADAKAVKIYAKAYNKSPEFYNFIQTLNTYENTIDSTTQLILSSDGKYLRYLNP